MASLPGVSAEGDLAADIRREFEIIAAFWLVDFGT
jgi:hypothetical protein